jgi:hypothetical protein
MSVISIVKVALTLLLNLVNYFRQQGLINAGKAQQKALDEAQVTKTTDSAAEAEQEAIKDHITKDTDEAFDQEFNRSVQIEPRRDA